MSTFIHHIKLATENIVLASGSVGSNKDHYDYAEKMEKMLKHQLKEEMEAILADKENMEKNLETFINKID